jgi:CRISPR/Cas system-associated protein Cas10 (large subunit of type III CRISPR-Cas system)
MVGKTIHYCDLCQMDGDENVVAVAKYQAEDNEFYDVCKKHFKLVKQAKNLDYTML